MTREDVSRALAVSPAGSTRPEPANAREAQRKVVVWEVRELKGPDLLYETPVFRGVFEFIAAHRSRGGGPVRVTIRR